MTKIGTQVEGMFSRCYCFYKIDKFGIAFMYYEFLNWPCLLDGNLKLSVEVWSCRNPVARVFIFKEKEIWMFSEGWWELFVKATQLLCIGSFFCDMHCFLFCLLVFLSPFKQWVLCVPCLWQGFVTDPSPFSPSHFKILDPLMRIGFLTTEGFSPDLGKKAL